MVPTLWSRKIRRNAAIVNSLVGNRIGFPIFVAVAGASFTNELLTSINR
jgi:hypothetical protein